MSARLTTAVALAALFSTCLAPSLARAETDQDHLYLLYSLTLAETKCNLPVSADQHAQISASTSAFEKRLHLDAAKAGEGVARVAQAMDEAIKPNPQAACKEMNALLSFALQKIPKPN